MTELKVTSKKYNDKDVLETENFTEEVNKSLKSASSGTIVKVLGVNENGEIVKGDISIKDICKSRAFVSGDAEGEEIYLVILSENIAPYGVFVSYENDEATTHIEGAINISGTWTRYKDGGIFLDDYEVSTYELAYNMVETSKQVSSISIDEISTDRNRVQITFILSLDSALTNEIEETETYCDVNGNIFNL